MKILYFWDAYCGWCYGFNKLFTEFYKNHTDIEIEIVSGGLYILENSNKISEYTFKNEEIVDMYKVEFGEVYNR